MTFARIYTSSGSAFFGDIIRRTPLSVTIQDHHGDVIQISRWRIEAIETGANLHAAFIAARRRVSAAQDAAKPKPALSAEERDRLLREELGA